MIPKPDEIRAARESLGLTQTQAAELLGFKRLAWTLYETGNTEMLPALWAYWLHVTGIKRLPFPKPRSKK